MRNVKKSALTGLTLLFGGLVLLFSCQKEEVKEPVVETITASEKAETAAGPTSCTVSCFWGSATANCPGGGASCHCEWGSPVTSCGGGGTTTAASFNHVGVQNFQNFVADNGLNPILVQRVHQLREGFVSGDWNFYMQAQENYVNTILEQPESHQNLIDQWLASQN